MCKLLATSDIFFGVKCPKCSTYLHDNEDPAELDACEQWLANDNRYIDIDDLYLRRYNFYNHIIGHTGYACDIYLCNYITCRHYDMCQMYTLREVCDKYGVDKEVIYKLRKKVDRPIYACDDFKHTVYRLYDYNDAVCTDVVDEYIRFE